MVLENKNCDLSDPHGFSSLLIFDHQTKKLAGVRYEGLLPTYHWVSTEFKTIHDSINKKYPYYINDIIDYDVERNRFVVYGGVIRGKVISEFLTSKNKSTILSLTSMKS